MEVMHLDPRVFVLSAIFMLAMTTVACSRHGRKQENTSAPIGRSPSTSPDGARSTDFFPDDTSWDLYTSMLGKYPSPEGPLEVRGFVPRGTVLLRTDSLLVAAPFGMTLDRILREHWPVMRVRGLIDELSLLRLGSGDVNVLVYNSHHFALKGFIAVEHAFLIIRNKQFRRVWRLVELYDPLLKDTYDPPEFHYWDGDDDGVRELVVSNPYREKLPWKLRWSVFRWEPDKERFIPERGLLYSRYAAQNPAWVAFSVLEAAKYADYERLSQHIASHRGCDSPKAVYELLRVDIWEKVINLTVAKKSPTQVRVDLVLSSSRSRYLARAFVMRISDMPPVWRICRMKLLKYTSP